MKEIDNIVKKVLLIMKKLKMKLRINLVTIYIKMLMMFLENQIVNDNSILHPLQLYQINKMTLHNGYMEKMTRVKKIMGFNVLIITLDI